MATQKKKIEKRWRVTRWNFTADSPHELISTDIHVTKKPMTERKIRNMIKEDLLGADACFKLEPYR